MKHLKYYENIQSNDIEIIKENLYDLQDILGEYSIMKGSPSGGFTPSNIEYSIKWVEVDIQFPNAGQSENIDFDKLSNTINILKELKVFGNKIKSQLGLNTYFNLKAGSTNNSFFISLDSDNKHKSYQTNPLTGLPI